MYFLSAVPVMRIAERVLPWNICDGPAWFFYYPVWEVDVRVREISSIISWEDQMMDQILGKDGDWLETKRDGKFWMPFPTIVDCHREFHRDHKTETSPQLQPNPIIRRKWGETDEEL
jgi:hypothetical protein